MPGYLAFSLSWAAKRLAATAASGELPQITGSVPIRSRAIDLPGLTNDSLVGRHWNAISSRPAATLSYTSSPTSTRPICSATTISGMHRLHSVDRGIPAETTGMKGARAWVATSASGDLAAPTPIRWQPRRTASVAAPSVSSVDPEQDTAMTRSVAPTQPGSWYPCEVMIWVALLVPQTAASTSPAMPEPPIPATTMARGRSPPVTGDRSTSAQVRTADRTWAADDATWRSMPPGSAASTRPASSSRSVANSSASPSASRPVRSPSEVTQYLPLLPWCRAPRPPAEPGCRRAPGRPYRTRRCRRARWPPRPPAAFRGSSGRPECPAASRRDSRLLLVSVAGGDRGAADQPQHLVPQRFHGGLVGGFDVQPQQWLGVGRPQVEPPVRGLHGQPVQLVAGHPRPGGVHLADLGGDASMIGHLAVDLAAGAVPGVL